MKFGIYAVRDKLAERLVGGLQLQPHDAPAVRFFTDLAADDQTMIAKHLGDHELVRLGYVDISTGELVAALDVVVTGVQLQAMKEARNGN